MRKPTARLNFKIDLGTLHAYPDAHVNWNGKWNNKWNCRRREVDFQEAQAQEAQQTGTSAKSWRTMPFQTSPSSPSNFSTPPLTSAVQARPSRRPKGPKTLKRQALEFDPESFARKTRFKRPRGLYDEDDELYMSVFFFNFQRKHHWQVRDHTKITLEVGHFSTNVVQLSIILDEPHKDFVSPGGSGMV